MSNRSVEALLDQSGIRTLTLTVAERWRGRVVCQKQMSGTTRELNKFRNEMGEELVKTYPHARHWFYANWS